MLSDKCIHYEIPVVKRDPREWVVLASGPNQLDWHALATERKAHIFCMNGSIMLCDNPSCYIATDIEAKMLFAPCQAKLGAETEQWIGQESVSNLFDGYTIDGITVRTSAIWAIYVAAKIKNAKRIAVFGLYGAEDEKWPTVSHVGGEFLDQDCYYAALRKADFSNLTIANRHDIESPDNCNRNAAVLIRRIRKMFPDVSIELMGNGPVVQLVSKPGLLKWDKFEA